MTAMGELLERAIEEAHKLAGDEQEAIGALLLAEIESERRWDDLLSRPPQQLSTEWRQKRSSTFAQGVRSGRRE